ncbi:hypothetical protein ACS5PJ_17430 [Pseudarthrobacter sp. YS3]|uniref:hypothetical protein n=1 Tax=Pseudarthrobacter sp. YS3 TaxID=3453718 RepID=UPI003EED8083
MFTYKRNLNFSGSDPVMFEPLVSVIGSLIAETSITPDQFMIVGAEARNLLHRSFNLPVGDLSTTHDVDVALAMLSWDGFNQLTPVYKRMASTKSAIRFNIARVPVDVIPFGGVETDKGIVEVPGDGHLINVLGYTDAFAAADAFVLPGVGNLKVVAPWYYVILKLEALADRSQNFNYKDAQDIGTALFWLETSEGDAAWLYEQDLDALIANDLKVDITLAHLFGEHLAGLLDTHQHQRLLEKVLRVDARDFSSELRRGLFRTNTSAKNDAARERYEALVRGLADPRIRNIRISRQP